MSIDHKIEKTFYIPDLIHVEFIDKTGKPICKKNILIGIQTYASYKNDIDLYPFFSNEKGQLKITKRQIKERAKVFISYGLMDYFPIEYAKPDVKIYFWGKKNIERYMTSISQSIQNTAIYDFPGLPAELIAGMKEVTEKEKKELKSFTGCFNRSTNIEENIILTESNWNQPQKELFYKLILPI